VGQEAFSLAEVEEAYHVDYLKGGRDRPIFISVQFWDEIGHGEIC
jgi:hypothetical protein